MTAKQYPKKKKRKKNIIWENIHLHDANQGIHDAKANLYKAIRSWLATNWIGASGGQNERVQMRPVAYCLTQVTQVTRRYKEKP